MEVSTEFGASKTLRTSSAGSRGKASCKQSTLARTFLCINKCGERRNARDDLQYDLKRNNAPQLQRRKRRLLGCINCNSPLDGEGDERAYIGAIKKSTPSPAALADHRAAAVMSANLAQKQ